MSAFSDFIQGLLRLNRKGLRLVTLLAKQPLLNTIRHYGQSFLHYRACMEGDETVPHVLGVHRRGVTQRFSGTPRSHIDVFTKPGDLVNF